MAKRRTELVEIPPLVKTIGNVHRVPLKQWRKWNLNARWTFNNMMRQAEESWIFTHPAYEKLPDDLWQTIRWNMAWTAADLANEKKWDCQEK